MNRERSEPPEPPRPEDPHEEVAPDRDAVPEADAPAQGKDPFRIRPLHATNDESGGH